MTRTASSPFLADLALGLLPTNPRERSLPMGAAQPVRCAARTPAAHGAPPETVRSMDRCE